jgi:hypothetical protein
MPDIVTTDDTFQYTSELLNALVTSVTARTSQRFNGWSNWYAHLNSSSMSVTADVFRDSIR